MYTYFIDYPHANDIDRLCRLHYTDRYLDEMVMGRDHGGRGGNAAQRKRHKPVNSGSVGQQWPRFSGPPPSSQQNGYGEEKPVLLTGKFVELCTLIFNKLQMNI